MSSMDGSSGSFTPNTLTVPEVAALLRKSNSWVVPSQAVVGGYTAPRLGAPSCSLKTK